MDENGELLLSVPARDEPLLEVGQGLAGGTVPGSQDREIALELGQIADDEDEDGDSEEDGGCDRGLLDGRSAATATPRAAEGAELGEYTLSKPGASGTKAG